MDDSLNAFALPGGKIFINAGAIEKTYSEQSWPGYWATKFPTQCCPMAFRWSPRAT
jgi:hypothetical protein